MLFLSGRLGFVVICLVRILYECIVCLFSILVNGMLNRKVVCVYVNGCSLGGEVICKIGR